MSYPPPPWHLRGNAVLRLQPLPVGRVRDLVPRNLSLVPAGPGRTLGGIFLARYGAGSSRQYHELIVIPGVVRQGRRLGAWISHIYVDDEQALTAGREVWGLPKEPANFAVRETADRVEVEVSLPDSSLLCKTAIRTKRHPLRMPLVGPVISQRQNHLLGFAARGTSSFSITQWDLRVGGESPFAHLGLTGGRAFQLTHFDVILPAPQSLG